MIKYVIFDLDQTLVDTSCTEIDRRNRNWQTVYNKIPKMKLYSGITYLLEFLKQNNILFAVVTKSPKVYCEKVLAFFKIRPAFVIGYFEVMRRKPDPEALCLAMILFKHDKPNEVLHIGDEVTDIVASRAAGMISVGALWGTSNKLELEAMKPEFLVSDPKELIDLIKHID